MNWFTIYKFGEGRKDKTDGKVLKQGIEGKLLEGTRDGRIRPMEKVFKWQGRNKKEMQR